MENTDTPNRLSLAAGLAKGPWILAFAGILAFDLAWRFQGDESRLWLPGLGIGIALVSWLGWWVLPILAIDLLLVRLTTFYDFGIGKNVLVTILHIAHIGLAWWLYHYVARGSRWLDDPRSATIFLLLVPGLLALISAGIQAFTVWVPAGSTVPLFGIAAEYWLSRMVGILVLAPFLIVSCTPILLRLELVDQELPPAFFGERDIVVSFTGDRIELLGLTFASSMLGALLVWTHYQGNLANWMLWASCLILIVWTCIRQGLRGGVFGATVTSAVAVIEAWSLDRLIVIPVELMPMMQAGVQGYLLAFCSSALLVGVSASWIRANETRFRHVIGRIPFVIYSARLPHGIPTLVNANTSSPKRDSKVDMHVGPSISKLANVMLVSPACTQIFGRTPESLLGPFTIMLECIEPEDQILVIASLTQLCLQKQPVNCEYRLRLSSSAVNHESPPTRFPHAAPHRWIRDTLTPHYSEDGLVDGWDGLIEDITDQRNLSHNLRKMTNMLQVLITNLPTGVYFVQAPQGYPLLVNARARQLLGQREDLSAGMATLSKVFRLHRADGSEYPWEELPVSKALRLGMACRANDIVVHRADGRKIPLITWAAPIDLNNTGTPDAAVWVLEDFSAMQQAEVTRRRLEQELLNAKQLELVGRLASGVVHDFNNLLLVLMGLAGCAKAEVVKNHPVFDYLSRIEEVGEQAGHLAGQLLTFSKQRPTQASLVEVNLVVTQTLRLARAVIPENIDIQTDLDPALPPVLGDENQLKQVVMNLCLNARDAMPDGGKLAIHSDQIGPPRHAVGRWAHLSIQDTGCGMPEEVRSRIFEPFFSTKEHGTGLGLAVVQKIVNEAGGEIEVTSTLGAGTRFDIWFEAARG